MSMLNTDINNVLAVTYQLLVRLKVKANKNTILAMLEDHPDSTSLLAISDCLTALRVNHQAYIADKETYNSSELPFPFIAHFDGCSGRFVLVHSANENGLVISDEKSKNKQLPTAAFLQSWDGLVMQAKADKESGEQHYYQQRINYLLQQGKLPGLFIAICLLLLLNAFSLPISVLLGVKLAGVAVCVLLLAYSINENHTLLKNICGSGGRSGCTHTLSSEGAALTTWLSWSELGFYYFTGSFLVLLFFPVLTPVLSWMNIAALPFTVYSISYQYKMKNWCLLCCTIQGLLLLECLTLYHITGTFSNDLTANLTDWTYFFLCFLFPILAWNLQKPILVTAELARYLKHELKKFKYNSELFTYTLRKQEYHAVDEELMPVILGNPQAKTVVTIVSDPYCKPCAEVHRFIDKWLQQTEDLQVKLLFYINNPETNHRNQVAYQMMALSLSKDVDLAAQALKDWYDMPDKNQEVWAKKYPVMITPAVLAAGAKQKAWREKTEITFTPTIFVNGYKMPEPYKIEDLKQLID